MKVLAMARGDFHARAHIGRDEGVIKDCDFRHRSRPNPVLKLDRTARKSEYDVRGMGGSKPMPFQNQCGGTGAERA
jgi:hypothetical protein